MTAQIKLQKTDLGMYGERYDLIILTGPDEKHKIRISETEYEWLKSKLNFQVEKIDFPADVREVCY